MKYIMRLKKHEEHFCSNMKGDIWHPSKELRYIFPSLASARKIRLCNRETSPHHYKYGYKILTNE